MREGNDCATCGSYLPDFNYTGEFCCRGCLSTMVVRLRERIEALEAALCMKGGDDE